MQAVVDRNLTCSHIGNHHGDEEGADALGSLVKEALIGAVHRLDAADARADIRTNAVAIHTVQIETCILECHTGGDNGELGIAIHALCLFLVDVAVNAELLDLTRNLRSVACRVEAGNAVNAVLACKQRLPEGVLTNADRRDRANPRDDNSLLQTNRLLS